MSKAKGLHTYTVAEAQNATMGQAGVAFISGTATYEPPTGKVVVAIQVILQQKQVTLLTLQLQDLEHRVML